MFKLFLSFRKNTNVLLVIGAFCLMMTSYLRCGLDPFTLAPTSDDQSAFENFNNETGADDLIVPNIIHLIRFNKTEFSFGEFICILAAFHNHQPEAIFIHTNVASNKFQGKYWNLMKIDSKLYSLIKILPLELPSEIFGQKLSEKWRLYHGGDIVRIRTIMKYGGIFLDNNVYTIKNLDKYRKFEIAINWEENLFLGSQVIIANKDARFLSLWLESYRDHYRSDLQ